MHEIVTSIKVIKMYAWENSFKMIVEKARRYEKGKFYFFFTNNSDRNNINDNSAIFIFNYRLLK